METTPMPLKIEDIIDLKQFQMLQDRLNEIYSFPSAIIDNEGKVHTATAWQDLCTKFHRQNTECLKQCIKSDQYIADHLHEANPAVSYRCPHGLIDNATPIVIEGVHYGNFFTGQFFLEPPDLNFFRAQAKKYGFDEDAYLEAVKKVPIWTEEQLNSYLFFIKGLIEVISAIGLKNLREIEARKRIQESEERYQSLLEQAADGIFILGLDGKIVTVNQSFAAMHGYTVEEILRMGLDGIDVNGIAPAAERISRIIRGETLSFEVEHHHKDGHTFPLSVTANLVLAGQEKMIIAMHRDLTERKQAEEQLLEMTNRLHLATASAKAGVWDWNLQTGEMLWDDRMLELYGLTHVNFPGGISAWEQGLYPADSSRSIEECQAALRGERDFDTEFRVQRPDGTVIHIKANGLVLRDETGKPVSMIGLNTDITERKAAEQEKERLQTQLTQAQKMESVGRLAGGVAHDFNNMLGVILGHVEMAMEQVEPSQPLHVDLVEIRNAAERSADLTRQLLAFARKQVVSPKVLDLNDTVEGMLKMLRRLIGEDIDLTWHPGSSPWPVKIDPSQVDQILANLCVNARDAISGVGKVTIETGHITFGTAYCADHTGFHPGEYVMLAVSDNGCGMNKEILSNLFEPFFTTKGMGKGTGLGLATVYGIVKQNNGFINVYSEPDQGTTFKIYLPRHIGKVEQVRTEVAEPLRRGRETILVVEDEPSLLDLSKIMLEKQGYRVLAAAAPSEAVRLTEEHEGNIHLLMTDVVMPEMNGRDLADKMLSLNPNLKCLFTSGYTANVIAHHGVLDENVHFIQKPFSRRDLAAKVREVLDSK